MAGRGVAQTRGGPGMRRLVKRQRKKEQGIKENQLQETCTHKCYLPDVKLRLKPFASFLLLRQDNLSAPNLKMHAIVEVLVSLGCAILGSTAIRPVF